MKSLLFSADLAHKEMTTSGEAAEAPDRNGRGVPASIAGIAVPASSVVGMLFGLTVFVLFPSKAADWLRPWLHPSDTALNLIEGGIRIALVLGYIWTSGRMKEVKRLFRYHGAEHKAINGLEQEGVADVDVAMRQSRIHPRCGTNFVLTVLLIKVGVFALFGWKALWIRLLLRVLLLPVVAAVAYELIRLAGKYRDVPGIQLLVLPGLLTQRLTTAEPDRGMVEVAVASLKSVLRREQTRGLLHDSDEEMRAMAEEELSELQERVERLEHELKVFLLPKDPNDERDVLVEVRAGTGGEEAALFAGELLRMYTRYAERMG